MDPIIDYRTAQSTSVVLTQFMNRVYGWMTFGLLITAVVSYVIGTDPVLVQALAGKIMFLIILQFGLVMGLSFGINRIGVGAATAMFLAYSFITGVVFSTLFILYTQGSLFQTFGVTAGAFAGLAIWGSITKRDLTAMGTFMTMGLWGIIIAMIVNFFLKSSALDTVVSFAGVLIFSGLTAWDVQKIRAFGMRGQTDTDAGHKFAIIGALTLYLDFINLFLFLLRFMGNGNSRRD
jgi:FtsH-binding integral membrane protein